MAKFRHHRTLEELTTRNEDEIAELDADPIWQRIEDDDSSEPEPEQSLDDIVEQLGFASAEHRNLLREALSQFEDDEPSGDVYDPSTHSVAAVNEYLVTADLDETNRVLAAEAAGKARAGIVTGPHASQS